MCQYEGLSKQAASRLMGGRLLNWSVGRDKKQEKGYLGLRINAKEEDGDAGQ
jgi:hypothetical protein